MTLLGPDLHFNTAELLIGSTIVPRDLSICWIHSTTRWCIVRAIGISVFALIVPPCSLMGMCTAFIPFIIVLVICGELHPIVDGHSIFPSAALCPSNGQSVLVSRTCHLEGLVGPLYFSLGLLCHHVNTTCVCVCARNACAVHNMFCCFLGHVTHPHLNSALTSPQSQVHPGGCHVVLVRRTHSLTWKHH